MQDKLPTIEEIFPLDREKIRQRLIKVLRSSPRSIRYYAKAIGLSPITLKRIMVFGVAEHRSFQLVENFVNKILGPDIIHK